MKYQTIQKVAHDLGVDCSYIRTMIKNQSLIPYKIEGYKRLYIDVEELTSLIKPIYDMDTSVNLDDFLI